MRSHSATRVAIFSVSPASAVKSAAMYSTGIIRLHIRGLVGDFSVACCVRLVESVRGKRLDELPELLCCLLRQLAVFDKSFDEFLFLRFHFLRNLLAHCFAECVGFEPGVAAKSDGGQKHIVLVHEKP